MCTRVAAFLFILLYASPLVAQRAAVSNENRKQARAVRVDNDVIHVDGRLDETAWAAAPAIDDFVQKEPNEGANPSERTEIRFLYDDGALYIGARMHKRSESRIQAPMGRRDDTDQSERLLVALDTFLDRRTAYVFGITPAGVRIDRYHPRDSESTYDTTYDPVWQARTAVDTDAWTAELWIPFAQLRFNNESELVWGLNVHRHIPTLDEDDYWTPIPRTATAWSSRFGDLRGIRGLPSNRRLEVVAYAAGASTVIGDRNPANPFDGGGNLVGRGGADLKLGLGPNLTIDATFNPDFGQVEADPAEVNLTAFETFFSEKRPFFIEGASVLNLTARSNFFYSRRVGAPPSGPASGDFVDYPDTKILGAAKLTGRLPSGTSIGMMSAVTNEAWARISNLSTPGTARTRVAPRTFFNLARVQQEFGADGSTVSGFATVVHRDLDERDPLAGLLVRNAISLAADSLLRFNQGEYELTSFAGGTILRGEPAAISRIQRNSTHYLQRPDQTHTHFDPARASLAGDWYGTTFARTGGRHLLWSVNTEFQSPTVDTNDIGRMGSADQITLNGDIRYRETVPGKVLRSYWFGVRQNNGWTNGRTAENKELSFYTNQTWRNFWASQVTYSRNFLRYDPRLTRGGPLMAVPPGWTLNMNVRNSSTAQTAWTFDLTTGGDDDGGFNHRVAGHLSFRPGPRWQFSIDPAFQRQLEPQQYITTLAGDRPETFGSRYVFGGIDRSTYAMQFRVGYAFKPDVTLDVYAEPFAASGRYSDIGELLTPSTRLRLEYGTNGTTVEKQSNGDLLVTDGASQFTLRNNDFNVHSFRSNVVFRWEYLPGSNLFLVWQQNRRLSEPIGSRIDFVDPFRSLTVTGDNSFVIKTTFWMPIG